jgi:hypothetical protein
MNEAQKTKEQDFQEAIVDIMQSRGIDGIGWRWRFSGDLYDIAARNPNESVAFFSQKLRDLATQYLLDPADWTELILEPLMVLIRSTMPTKVPSEAPQCIYIHDMSEQLAKELGAAGMLSGSVDAAASVIRNEFAKVFIVEVKR